MTEDEFEYKLDEECFITPKQLLDERKKNIENKLQFLTKDKDKKDIHNRAIKYYNSGFRVSSITLNKREYWDLTYKHENEFYHFDYLEETQFIMSPDELTELSFITEYKKLEQKAGLRKADNSLKTAEDFMTGNIDFTVKNRTEIFDQLLSYNDAFYARVKGTNNMVRITQTQAKFAIYHSYYDLESNTKLKDILSIIQEDKDELPHIPDYVFRPAKPRDNGFRFNKTAYRLIHYYLREASIKNKYKYIITIMSKGNMGKSTFSNFLKYLFKNEYYSADSKYTNQFSSSFYASSRLTVFNDCSNEYLANSHVLKQVSGGDDMQIEAKGKQGYSGYIDAYLLFIGNEDLRYNILDSGLLNRFVNMPWDDTVIKEHYTPDFGYEEVEPVKDLKWLNYEWTDDEIAFQIELADKLYEYDLKDKLDLQKLCDKTVAKVYLNHPAIRRSNDFTSFLKYCEDNHIKMHWSEENYNQYLYGIEDYINKGIITREEVEKAREYKALSVQNLLGVKSVSPIAED